MYPNKRSKKHISQGDSTSTSSMGDLGVKKLIDTRNTIENNCFSGLDYELMEGLFGKSCAPEIAQILYNSPPPFALSSQFSQNQSKDLVEQPECVMSENFQNGNSSTISGVPQEICEGSVDIKSSCPSMSPLTSEVRVECQAPENRFDDDVTDCDSPNKQLMPCEASVNASYTTEGSNNILEECTIDIQHTANDVIDISYPNSPSILPPLTSEFSVDRGKRSDDNLTDSNVIKEAKSTSEGQADGTKSEIEDSDTDPDYENQESDISNLSESGNEENFPLPKTRKRKANPEQWERNKVKELRNSGQEYNTLKKGTLVPSRQMGPPCIATCRRKCTQKINEDERKEYFQSYWSLKDVNRQRQCIANSIEVIQPKYRYPVLREHRKARKLNHSFFFSKNHVKIYVCKIFFTSTLGITNRCIRTVIEKTEKGFTERDRRGKHEKHVTIPKEVKDGARSHISSIPTVESHYTRADSSKNYIEGGRTLMDLYRDYKQECQKQNRNFVTFSIYRNIFNYEFNYEFFKPKKDLCQFCESYKNKNHGERLDTEIEYMRHHDEKNIARSEKEEDKTRITKNYRVACFDLQAALPTPRGEVSTFYYKSKLSTYNFTICELNKKGLGAVHCYVWHEGEGHKGSNEIGSCLLHYLEISSLRQDVAGCSKDSDEVEVVLYSDNCGGQGKNKFIIAAYLYAVSNFNIKSITHKFLVVGHTQNEGDVSHSLIEKNIKKALKSNPIYLPSQYATLISTAKKSGELFKVHELDHSFFYDLKDLVDTIATNFNSNTDGEKFNFKDICVLRVEKDNPGVYFYKTSYKDDNYKMVNIRASRTRKQLKLIKYAQLKKAYPERIPISQRKFQDLMSLVNSNTIPRCYADFFENLKHD